MGSGAGKSKAEAPLCVGVSYSHGLGTDQVGLGEGDGRFLGGWSTGGTGRLHYRHHRAQAGGRETCRENYSAG